MNATRIESIVRVRSFLVNGVAEEEDPNEKLKRFALGALRLIPGPLDLGQVISLRRYAHPMHDVPLKLPDFWDTWDRPALGVMQMRSKPIADRRFCHLCLAMAMDLGIDIPGERLLAIQLSLHPRVGAESNLRVLGNDLVGLIANMSLWE